MNILEEILSRKREEVAAAKALVCADAMAERAAKRIDGVRGFRAALRDGPAPRVIAEVKRRSPSRGEIRTAFDPVAIAKSYVAAGAAAISVLTDEHYFGGHLDYLEAVRAAMADSPEARLVIAADQASASGVLISLADLLGREGLGAFSIIGTEPTQTPAEPE